MLSTAMMMMMMMMMMVMMMMTTMTVHRLARPHTVWHGEGLICLDITGSGSDLTGNDNDVDGDDDDDGGGGGGEDDDGGGGDDDDDDDDGDDDDDDDDRAPTSTASHGLSGGSWHRYISIGSICIARACFRPLTVHNNPREGDTSVLEPPTFESEAVKH